MTAPLASLSARNYWDPAVYQAERDKVFAPAWHLLGPADQVAASGAYLAEEVAGWKILVVRGRDGALRGFHNVCRHRAAPLVPRGLGKVSQLRCGYHRWVYDLTGALKDAPDFGEADWFCKADYPLRPVSVGEWRGLLFVSLAQMPEPLEQALGGLVPEIAEVPLERYQAVREVRFEMACNWKTYTDNFIEGYHVPGIHAAFAAVIDFGRFETVAFDNVVRMTAPQKDGSIYGGKWMWVWPGMTLSTFPGGMNTSRINPTGVRSCELIYHFYFEDLSAESAEARERTIARNCEIIREDFGICEDAQANLESGAFESGPLSPRHEQSLVYFHDRLRQQLGKAHAKAAE